MVSGHVGEEVREEREYEEEDDGKEGGESVGNGRLFAVGCSRTGARWSSSRSAAAELMNADTRSASYVEDEPWASVE